ncbi:hypothetical protein DB346_17285 [Verrucomicrobia bacterium LW23]|nr:hypothetical protein DB346_17285 [Verrucomicrobia bacterium LW23]
MKHLLLTGIACCLLTAATTDALAAPADDALRTAATKGDMAQAKQAIRDGADINAFHEGRTPLMHALERNDGAMVEALIAAGAKSQGVTPLLIAVLKQDAARVKELLAASAKARTLNAKTDWQENALHYAVRIKNAEIARLLIRAGVYIEQRDENGCTPLMWAIRADSDEMVTLLLDNKANVNMRNSYTGETPIFIAACEARLSCFNILLSRGGKYNILDFGKNSALTSAMMARDSYGERDDAESKAMTERFDKIIATLKKLGAVESEPGEGC